MARSVPGGTTCQNQLLPSPKTRLDPGPLHPRNSPPLWVKDKDSEGGREKESVCVTCLMSYQNDHHKEQPYSTNWSQGLEYGGISSGMNKALSDSSLAQQTNMTPSWPLSTAPPGLWHPTPRRLWRSGVPAPLGTGGEGTSRVTSSSNLPVYKSQRIDVGTLEGVKVFHVDGFIQYFRSHVSGM